MPCESIPVYIDDFDGSTDDERLQDALETVVLNGGIIKACPGKIYQITQPHTVVISRVLSNSMFIDFSGAKFELSSWTPDPSPFIKITIDLPHAPYFDQAWNQFLHISGISTSGGENILELNGGGTASGLSMGTIDKLMFAGYSGTGLAIRGNVFCFNISNCFLLGLGPNPENEDYPNGNVDGYGILLAPETYGESTVYPGQIDVYSCRVTYGKMGLRAMGEAGHLRIIGGTYTYAAESGIHVEVSAGATIIGTTCEDNHRLAPDLGVGETREDKYQYAGISIGNGGICIGNGGIAAIGIQPDGRGKQNYAVRMAANAPGLIIGGYSYGMTKYALVGNEPYKKVTLLNLELGDLNQLGSQTYPINSVQL